MTQAPVQEQGPEYWRKRAGEVAIEQGLDPGQFTRLIGWESGFDPTATNPSGATGLGQFMPSWIGAGEHDWRTDPEASLSAAAGYLKENYGIFGNWRQAYAAYFYGAGGLKESLVEPYGADWEQYMDPSYRGELEYVFGGPASERALATPVPQPAGLGRAGIPMRGAPKSPFADIPDYFTGYRDLLDQKLDELKLLSGQVTANDQAVRNWQVTSNQVSDEAVYEWYAKQGWSREEVAIARTIIGVSPEARALGLELRMLSEPERQRYLAQPPGPEVGPAPPSLKQKLGQFPSWEEARQAVRDANRASAQGMIDLQVSSTDQLMHESAVLTMMQLLPMLIVSGDVNTVDDAITWFRTNSGGRVNDTSGMSVEATQTRRNEVSFTQEDREFFSYLIQNLSPALDLTPDVPAADIVAALARKNRPTPKLLTAMTADQINNMLFGAGKPFEMPEGVTEPQLRAFFRSQGMDDQEYTDTVAGIKAAASMLIMDWFNKDQDYMFYREGITLPVIPDASFMDKLKVGFTQPASALGPASEFLRDYISKPFAAQTMLGWSHIFQSVGLPPIRGTQSMEESFRRSALEGEGYWEALALAFDDWEAPGVVKFAAEVAFDPINIVGTGIFTSLTRRIPVLGPFIGALERGWIAALNVPFAALGKGYRIIVPKTLEQIGKGMGKDTAQYVVSRYAVYANRMEGVVGLEDAKPIQEFIEEGLLKYVQDPVGTKTGGPAWEVGAYLAPRLKRLIQEPEATSWARALGSKTELTDQAIFDINHKFSLLYDSGIHGYMKVGEMAQVLLAKAGIAASDESLRKAAGLIDRRITSDNAAISRLFRDDPIASLTRLSSTVQDVFLSNAKSKAWQFAETTGRSMAIARLASGPLRWTPLLMMDRFAVQPVASAYLLFLGYGPMNFIESTFRVARAGIEPELARSMRPTSLTALQENLGYLNIPYDVSALGPKPRMEMAVLPASGETKYGEGPIAFLIEHTPGVGRELPFANIKYLNKIPRPLWSLQNFNDFWSRVSTFQRALYIQKQMVRQLHDVAPDAMKVISEALGDPEKLGILSFIRDTNTRQEAYEHIFFASVHSPDSVLRARTTVEKLMARRYESDLLAIFDAHPEIEQPFVDAILQKAWRGELTIDTLDTVMSRGFSAIQDGYLAKLPARAAGFKRWADEMIGVGELPKGPGLLKKEPTRYGYATREATEKTELPAEYIGYYKPATDPNGVTEYRIVVEDAGGGVAEIRNLTRNDSLSKGLPGKLEDVVDQMYLDLRASGFKDVKWVAAEAGGEARQAARERLFNSVINRIKASMEPSVRVGMSKDEARAAFRQLTDAQTQAEELLETHYQATTHRAGELKSPLERDKLHTQAYKDMMEFSGSYEDSVGSVLDSLRANATQVFAEGPERTSMLRILDSLEDQFRLSMTFHQEQRRIIDDWIAKAPSRSKVNWDASYAERGELWAKYRKERIPLITEYNRAAMMLDPQGLHGTIDHVTGQLAPVNVARLFATSGDDVSRGMNQVMLYGGIMSKDTFTIYVKGRANVLAEAAGRTADDLGFSDKAIGRVYDQIMAKIKLDPNIGGPLEPLRQSLEGIRGEIHSTLASKAIKPEDVGKLNQYLEDVAGKLRNSGLFQQKVAGVVPLMREEVDLLTDFGDDWDIVWEELADMKGLSPTVSVYADVMASGGTAQGYKLWDQTGQFSTFVDLLKTRPYMDQIGTELERTARSYQALLKERAERVGMGQYVDAGDFVGFSSGVGFSGFNAKEADLHAIVVNLHHEVRWIREMYPDISDVNLALEIADSMEVIIRHEVAHNLIFADVPSHVALTEALFKENLSAGEKLAFKLEEFFEGLRARGTLKEILDDADQFGREAEGLISKLRRPRGPAAAGAVAPRPIKRALWGTESDLERSYQQGIRVAKRLPGAGEGRPEVRAMAQVPERGGGKPGVEGWEATPEWSTLREQAMDKTRLKYELDFTQYGNDNAFNAFARRIMPFWTYESQRWPYLARAMIQTPGVFAGWGKYMDYSDTGYIPIKGTDLEINPFRGTVVMGGFRRFSMKDYPEYYDRMNPGLTQFMDYASKAGFYPGIHIALPMAIWGGERSQLGEVLPAFMKTGLNAMVGIGIPGAKQLQETVFPERFRDYQIGLVVSELAQDRRLDVNGPDVLRKRREGIELSADEQRLWDEATRRVARTTAALFETTGMMRLAPEQRSEAWRAVDLMREAITGVPYETQQTIRNREGATGESFSDLFPLSPLDQERLNQTDAYKYWIGSTSPLIPESYQKVIDRIGTYWESVGAIWDTARTTGFKDDEGNPQYLSLSDLDQKFRSGEMAARDYTKMVGDTIGHTVGLVEGLNQGPFFKGVPTTLKERVAWYEDHNIPTPTFSPGQELTWMYYELSPKLTQDEEGNYTYDFGAYYAQVDAIIDSMPDPVRAEFLEHIQRDWTPTQQLYWQVSRDFLRPYRNLRDTLIQQYTPEEQKVLRQFTHAEGAELEALKLIVGADGNPLISSFESKLRLVHENYREVSPETDAWLYFWGKTETLRTKESEVIYADMIHRYRPGVTP